MANHINYTNRMQYIKRGNELLADQIEPKSIYAVNYKLKKKTAELYNCYQEQWGIVVLNESKEIVLSYNYGVHNGWQQEVKPIANCLHFFTPTIMEELFIHQYKGIAEEREKAHKMKKYAELMRDHMNQKHDHWLMRASERLIKFFS